MGSWLSATAQLMADARANVLGKGAEHNPLLQKRLLFVSGGV